jgi:nucleotide-binding universal stress UspA family protein
MKNLRILIPLDGSEFSQQILPYLRQWLDPATTDLIFLRVYTKPVHGLVPRPPTAASADWRSPHYEAAQDANLARHPIYASQMRDSLRAELETDILLNLNDFRQAGYPVSVEIRFGEPAEEILAASQSRQVDMIAMTSHGRTGLSRLVSGSVAQQVLTKASVPVLLLRPTPTTAHAQTPPHQMSTN